MYQKVKRENSLYDPSIANLKNPITRQPSPSQSDFSKVISPTSRIADQEKKAGKVIISDEKLSKLLGGS